MRGIITPSFLAGVGTKIDPTQCRADRLVGQVLGSVGNLPPVYSQIIVKFYLLRRLLGVKMTDKKQAKVRIQIIYREREDQQQEQNK